MHANAIPACRHSTENRGKHLLDLVPIKSKLNRLTYPTEYPNNIQTNIAIAET